MTRFIVRRFVQTIPVLLGVATLVFLLIHLVPGDPVQAMLGDTAEPADVARLRTQLGLDRPLHVQYFAFLAGIARGDFGTSLRTREPVLRSIAERLPATSELAVAAVCIAVSLAIPLGVLAAVRARTRVDRAATLFALVGASVPGFWLGPMLALVFSIGFGWLPVSGRGTFAHLILPAITLSAPLAAVLMRLTRASVIEEIREPYVLAARARGASQARAVLRHALRNSLVPVITVLGLQVGSVLTGAVITETIFAWPGVGRLLVQSIGFRDYPMVQGCILLIAVIYVAVNLLVDVLYGALDPRIRMDHAG